MVATVTSPISEPKLKRHGPIAGYSGRARITGGFGCTG